MEEEIVARIKSLRQSAGYTIAELSQKLGFNSPTAYAKIEYGKTELKLRHLLTISEEFGVELSWLLGLEEPSLATSADITNKLQGLHFKITSYLELIHALKLASSKLASETPPALERLDEALRQIIDMGDSDTLGKIGEMPITNGAYLNPKSNLTTILSELEAELLTTLRDLSKWVREKNSIIK